MKQKVFQQERRSFDIALSLEKRNEGESREIKLTAAVFNSLSKRLGWGFVEKIEEGAFDGADMTDVVACLNHNKDILYARTSSGTLSLAVTPAGLEGTFEAPETAAGNDLLVMVKRGDIRKASFEFVVDKDRWVNDPDHGEIRIIEKFRRILDISPVVFEAYPDTDVAKRSFDEFKDENEKKEEEKRDINLNVIHAEAEFQYLQIKNKY